MLGFQILHGTQLLPEMVLFRAGLIEIMLGLGKPRLKRLSLLEEDLDPLVGRLYGQGVLELELFNLKGVVRSYDGILEPLLILLGWRIYYVNNYGQGWKLN